jgi:hypothetical protein
MIFSPNKGLDNRDFLNAQPNMGSIKEVPEGGLEVKTTQEKAISHGEISFSRMGNRLNLLH